ncbi:hypothetical protein L9W92_09660 [Pelotomaculum terephthalicicum JT]|uniref:hypothetical protein n=1 Tax=Pelotomaculum TaxID=191373 RepID=UPI0009C731B1|nr:MULTISPECIES: hypothetical protein [Pelotomaculum]MCG9968317.1 hypothetical protein [Pelotomaculum terephthalicicum JT]OPX90727.1 MAG: hypothetical protein A4E54_00589 [Pelotomaculum sp. PtaB.Bin117]OPY63236.1 MAG: hypothetical protein A4E56_00710 [Pelotomaculum sp. PtaU1.Bin065]
MGKYRNIQVGIGFATGRKSFRKVLKTYVYNWRENGLTEREGISLNLLIAYDLKYSNTKPSDYTEIRQEVLDLIDNAYFIGKKEMRAEIKQLIRDNVINEKEARFFGTGYASQRNAILYIAIKNNLDYLIFLDDDEYPMAVTKTRSNVIWGGQHVLGTHLRYIDQADITHGYHCGYVSPIPYIEFNDILTERDFRLFIEAISNDIINWDSIRAVMDNGGVTYADTNVLTSDTVEEVKEINHCKFISGGNLCINLTNPRRVRPFYNPPDARGEDTFLSTCLGEHRVMRIPCYTFHDGFSTYNHLLDGVLPINLKYVKIDSEQIITRFYNACIGWIRYKPLLLYIAQRNIYDERIKQMRQQLAETLPKLCNYFKRKEFMNIVTELERYHNDVKKHYEEFLETQRVWTKICNYLNAGKSDCQIND